MQANEEPNVGNVLRLCANQLRCNQVFNRWAIKMKAAKSIDEYWSKRTKLGETGFHYLNISPAWLESSFWIELQTGGFRRALQLDPIVIARRLPYIEIKSCSPLHSTEYAGRATDETEPKGRPIRCK